MTRWFSRSRSAAGAAVVTTLVGIACLRPDLRLVERVVFDGQDRAHPAELRHLADIRNGTTIWSVDLEAAARGVERHPWVQSATARRLSLDTVVVEVVEHEPVALVAYDELYYLSASGLVFARARSDDVDYPVLSGVGPELRSLHPDLPRVALRDMAWMLRELDRRALVPPSSVSEIVFSPVQGYTLHIVDGAQVRFGLGRLPTQLSRFATLLDEGVDPRGQLLIDLGPTTVAIVHPLPVGDQG